MLVAIIILLWCMCVIDISVNDEPQQPKQLTAPPYLHSIYMYVHVHCSINACLLSLHDSV
jgi:hypothetical protein